MKNLDLRRGEIVIAIRHLDKQGADVRRGTLGVVFEEANAYNDGGGPMVRWMNMGACNVYPGDVIKLSIYNELYHSIKNIIENFESNEEVKSLYNRFEELKNLIKNCEYCK